MVSATRRRAGDLSFIAIAEKLCAGGAKILQLRAKDVPSRDFLVIAQEVRKICRCSGCLFIVNDRADIALAVDADGVHVGQEDLPLTAARKVLGPHRIIGVSTHDPQQAQTAERDGADYIGFGPMYGTTTKTTGYTARGLDQLRAIRAVVRLPIVAIGGITTERARYRRNRSSIRPRTLQNRRRRQRAQARRRFG